MGSNFNVPTILTLIRLILSPLLLPILFVYLLPYNMIAINSVLALIFVAFGLTDFFDGFLARRMKQETGIGRILDPIADKFLLYSTLVALLAVHKIHFFWVILFIGREFVVMGLRIFALENSLVVHVSTVGKLKTVVQILCLLLLILNPYQSFGLYGSPWWNGTEIVLMLTAIGLTIYSAYSYYLHFIIAFKKRTTSSIR